MDDTNQLRAIPTEYKGVQLKSRMEAQCAFLFDQLGWPWEYEPKSLMLDTGITYIPDFSVCGGTLTVECRGYRSERGDRQLMDFIKDPARKSDFLVMGPEACTVYRKGNTEPGIAQLTFCPLCDIHWSLSRFLSDEVGVLPLPHCSKCRQPTFLGRDLKVQSGVFLFDWFPFDEISTELSFDRNMSDWRMFFTSDILNKLGRIGLAYDVASKPADHEPIIAAMNTLFELLRPWSDSYADGGMAALGLMDGAQ